MAAPLLKRIAFRFGYDFTFRKLPQYALRNRKLKLPRDMEPEFVPLYEAARDYTLTSPECLYALYQAVRHVVAHQIPGDLVECGVWRGGSAMMMAQTLQALGVTDRKIHLYDTFAGMTQPGEIDVRRRDGAEQVSRWQAFQRDGFNEWTYAPLEEVQTNMRRTGFPEQKLVYVAGPVEDTLPATRPERISVLRLDTDWYESTHHEFTHLFPLLQPGGLVIVDDYGAYEGARRATDSYLAESGVDLFLHRIDTSARIGVKRA